MLRHARTFSTTCKPVRLAFDKYSPKQTPRSPAAPLVICHGLFGSKQNWTSLCRAAAQRYQRDIYAVDLRNHGDSPQDPHHDFQAMASDLLAFMDDHQLENPILMGHSMGGKAVLRAALEAPERISKAISVDMPPVPLTLSRGFRTYIQGMREVDAAQCTKQSQADAILQKYEENIGIRMFLLTNLKRQQDSATNALRIRLPLDILDTSLDHLGQFPIDNEESAYHNPTLFLAGGKSPYYPPFLKHDKNIKQLFPQSRLEVVDGAGHWVHAEKPEQVLQAVGAFLQDN
ncbi:Alpha/Beta hydrolase protein [Gongronella butleri]|nr:Alpha/Beta hydrolase protein [Gongronella butleri]